MSKISFMFDYGAYSCLWDEYDGLLSLERFPISKEMIDKLESLSIEFNSILNWDDPASGFVWTAEQIEDFRLRAQQAYDEMMAELGDGYEIQNCINLSLNLQD